MSGAFGPSGDNSQVYPGFFENPHFAPPILAARTVNAGTMGRSEGHPHSLLESPRAIRVLQPGRPNSGKALNGLFLQWA